MTRGTPKTVAWATEDANAAAARIAAVVIADAHKFSRWWRHQHRPRIVNEAIIAAAVGAGLLLRGGGMLQLTDAGHTLYDAGMAAERSRHAAAQPGDPCRGRARDVNKRREDVPRAVAEATVALEALELDIARWLMQDTGGSDVPVLNATETLSLASFLASRGYRKPVAGI